MRDIDDQLSGISYAIGSLRNDLRQIERSDGADDNGPFGMKKVVFGASLFFKTISAASIILMAAVTAALMGLRVRRMKPVEMITEE